MSSSRRNEESANLDAIIANNRDEVHEDNIAAYVETTQRLGRLNLQFGLRYEHVDSRYFNG
jgi:outer membrane receptor protein involved in Fe transport